MWKNAKTIYEETKHLLSDASSTLLRIFGKEWAVGQAFMTICYLELLFEKFKKYEVPTLALLVAYEDLHDRIKLSGWLSEYEVS